MRDVTTAAGEGKQLRELEKLRRSAQAERTFMSKSDPAGHSLPQAGMNRALDRLCQVVVVVLCVRVTCTLAIATSSGRWLRS
jgi:hypothetical protein